MRLVLNDPRLFKESVNIISELVNEVTFKIDKDMVSVAATDPANISMVNFKLLSSAFDEYEVEKPTTLAVNLENLKAVLKRVGQTDSLILRLDENNNKLSVEIVGNGKRVFNLALLDLDADEQKVPNLKFNAKVTIPSTVFDNAISDMEIVSDSVSLIASNENFLIKAKGHTSDAKVELPVSDNVSVKLEEDSAKAKYALSYLTKMTKGSKFTDSVTLSFSNEYPLMISYLLQDKLELSFILAPRVDED